VISENVSVNALPQTSVTTGTANDGVAGQLIVVGTGKAAMTGALISRTSIDCDKVEKLPHPSVAVHVLIAIYVPAQGPGVVISA